MSIALWNDEINENPVDTSIGLIVFCRIHFILDLVAIGTVTKQRLLTCSSSNGGDPAANQDLEQPLQTGFTGEAADFEYGGRPWGRKAEI